MIGWTDRVMFTFLILLMALLPFSTAAVEIASASAILAYLLNKAARVSGAWAGPDSQRPGRVRAVLALPFPEAWALRGAGLYVLVCAVSVLFSRFPAQSVRGFFGKTLESFFLFLVVQEVLRTPARVRIFLGTFVLAVVVLCLDAFWQLSTGTDLFKHLTMDNGRICASLKHPNALGGYLLLAVLPLGVLAGALSLSRGPASARRPRWQVVGMLSAFFLALICLGLTFSRGAWVGMAAAVTVFIGLQRTRWKQVLGAAVVLFGLFTVLMVVQRRDYQDLPQAVAQGHWGVLIDGNGRQGFWREAISVFRESPLIGTGLNTYTSVMQARKKSSGYYAHNGYLQMAAEMGALGVGVFLFFIAGVLGTGVRRLGEGKDPSSRALVAAFLASWCGALVHGGLDTTFYSSQLWPLIWVLAGVVVALPAVLKNGPFLPSGADAG